MTYKHSRSGNKNANAAMPNSKMKKNITKKKPGKAEKVKQKSNKRMQKIN